MKIQVRTSNRNVRLWIPNSLILSGFIRNRLISQIYKSSNGRIPFPPAVMNHLFMNLKEIAQEYKGLNLVEAETSDGTEILIQL